LPVETAITPASRQRLQALYRDAVAQHVGQVEDIVSYREAGLFWTDCTVLTTDGEAIMLRTPGGTIDGITQEVGETLPPEPGDELLLAPQRGGGVGWAQHRSGKVFGGWLGHGPAVPLPHTVRAR